jgi:endonuclease YncB( thermonuclease family)
MTLKAKTLSLAYLLSCIQAFSMSATADDQRNIIRGTVTVISDGDTIHIKSTGEAKKIKVRMEGIDTPELHLQTSDGTFTQGPIAQEASDHLTKEIPIDSKVDLFVYGKDKYGRTLGRIERSDKDINLEMVRSGMAIPYIICEGKLCNDNFFKERDVANYLAACRSAREQGLGIFDPNDPLEEMPFEFRLRIQKRKPEKFVGDIRTKQLYQPHEYKKVDLCDRIFFMKEADAGRVGFH